MIKLLFPAAILAPVMMLAVSAGGASPLPALNGASLAETSINLSPTGTPLDNAPSDCRSETIGVSFHDAYLESHSAERLGEVFTDVPGCQLEFVRLSTFVVTSPTEADIAEATARRTELALHIQALIGEDAAKTLTVATDMRTRAADSRRRTHALVHLEHRPASPGAPVLSAENAAGGPSNSVTDMTALYD